MVQVKLGLTSSARTFRRRAIHWLQSPDSDLLPTLALPCFAICNNHLQGQDYRHARRDKNMESPEEGEIDHIKQPISGRAIKSAGTSAIFGAQYRHEHVE